MNDSDLATGRECHYCFHCGNVPEMGEVQQTYPVIDLLDKKCDREYHCLKCWMEKFAADRLLAYGGDFKAWAAMKMLGVKIE